jgi:hypothetical protein
MALSEVGHTRFQGTKEAPGTIGGTDVGTRLAHQELSKGNANELRRTPIELASERIQLLFHLIR